MSRKGRRSGAKRSYTVYIVLGLIVVTGVVGYYIFTQSGANSTGSPLVGQPVSQTVLNYLAGPTTSTLNYIGPGATGATSITSTNSTSPLTSGGKPEVLYMGAEYCPFCAAERWAMIVALDKFGNFSGLEYMQSAPSPEAYPNTATFTFVHATYTSNYVSFVPVETEDNTNNHNPLMTATAEQTSLMNSFDPKGSIPFVDIANRYILVGSQITPPTLAGANWTQIGYQLGNVTNGYAKAIDGAANRLIGAICKVDGGSPASICSQSLAIGASYTRTAPPGNSQLIVSDEVLTAQQQTAVAARFAPTRLISRV